ncbi:hypothetical protein A605_09300 [Corynebacterium halotolerans YIM 70093 = DSM 44683]|uniref:Uncharacterized protein n=1 Tax=Corynebacterium halotolerans YIM 70093 = DSM 44683 TaxID=1121362 RepID=M1NTQ9_9CORY|nr:hypothetical protein A605_09300 [Corynebacterium halotolerans YIM 70093 = DSM 44683]
MDVLWQETTPVTHVELQWRQSEAPGDLARIELACPTDLDFEGTAIFDLRRRMCLFHELHHRGEIDFRILVDAVRQDQQAAWVPLTEVGTIGMEALALEYPYGEFSFNGQ